MAIFSFLRQVLLVERLLVETGSDWHTELDTVQDSDDCIGCSHYIVVSFDCDSSYDYCNNVDGSGFEKLDLEQSGSEPVDSFVVENSAGY